MAFFPATNHKLLVAILLSHGLGRYALAQGKAGPGESFARWLNLEGSFDTGACAKELRALNLDRSDVPYETSLRALVLMSRCDYLSWPESASKYFNTLKESRHLDSHRGIIVYSIGIGFMWESYDQKRVARFNKAHPTAVAFQASVLRGLLRTGLIKEAEQWRSKFQAQLVKQKAEPWRAAFVEHSYTIWILREMKTTEQKIHMAERNIQAGKKLLARPNPPPGWREKFTKENEVMIGYIKWKQDPKNK